MRLQITRKSELALRALRCLDGSGRAKASAIAAAVDSSTAFVPQVLQPLVAAGWLRSDPGPAGGYELVVELDTVSLLDLIEAVEGPSDDGTCVLGRGPCSPARPCALHDAWVRARGSLLDQLAATPVRVGSTAGAGALAKEE